MGRIFTPEEVELKLVPNLSDFAVFVNLLKRDLAVCEGVIGGLICGSVARGCHNIRSDIDCLVLHAHGNEELVVHILTDLYRVAKRMHIPIGIIRLSDDIASTKMHHIGQGFADHMSKVLCCDGAVIKANPLPFLGLDGLDPKEDTRCYLRFKLRQLEKFQIEKQSIPEYVYYLGLSKMMNSAVHVARKVASCLGGKLEDDSSSNVCEVYPRYVDLKVKNIFRELTRADRQYSRVLSEHLQEFNRSAYEAAIQDIDDLLPVSIKFVRMNALMFA
ncbi:MAG: hypothetical protein WCV58_03380 [Patescibacteria group bacterium]